MMKVLVLVLMMLLATAALVAPLCRLTRNPAAA
jgi:hypothetical protein